jgi:hypothetical protein
MSIRQNRRAAATATPAGTEQDAVPAAEPKARATQRRQPDLATAVQRLRQMKAACPCCTGRPVFKLKLA